MTTECFLEQTWCLVLGCGFMCRTGAGLLLRLLLICVLPVLHCHSHLRRSGGKCWRFCPRHPNLCTADDLDVLIRLSFSDAPE